MVGGRREAYENGKSTGAYLFYKEAIEALNAAAAESEKGAQETTTYENVADFLLAIYRKVTQNEENGSPEDGGSESERKIETDS